MVSDRLAGDRERVVRAAEMLVRSGVLSLSGHGNISARIRGTDTFLLTAGGSLEGLRPQDLALLRLDGTLLEGALTPVAAEIVAMHTAIYRLRPEAGGVVHTHSPYATSLAVAGEPIPLIYEALARWDMTDGVPVAAYGPRGSREAVEHLVRALQGAPHTRAVLLANHGVLAFGEDPVEAARVNLVVEEAALLLLHARLVGEARPIPPALAQAARQRRDAFAARGPLHAPHPEGPPAAGVP